MARATSNGTTEIRKRQMNKQQAAATELSWEVASELGSELGDDTPSAEIWPIREKPKQESLASLLANFTMPAVPLLQSLFEDFASELKKYKEHWTKKREQYKLYWIKIQEKCKRCLEFFECSLYKTGNQEPQEFEQEQQKLNKEASTYDTRSSLGVMWTPASSPGAATTPADPAKAGFAGQGHNTQ